jgi:hypothetical protein
MLDPVAVAAKNSYLRPLLVGQAAHLLNSHPEKEGRALLTITRQILPLYGTKFQNNLHQD